MEHIVARLKEEEEEKEECILSTLTSCQMMDEIEETMMTIISTTTKMKKRLFSPTEPPLMKQHRPNNDFLFPRLSLSHASTAVFKSSSLL